MTPAVRNPEIRAVLKRPFAEQVAFFRSKLGNLVPTAKWDDLWKSQHDRAFMVAGAAKADLLADLAAAVDRAIAQGGSIGQFRKDFDQVVAKSGWAYTGERNWRTRTIYRTNAATSYAAGRLAQLREGGFPYWMYKHGGSADPRPQHLAWNGIVLPADHPFWQTHSPPNGWGCSCRIVGVRRKEDAVRLGGKPDKELPDGWDSINPRTGEPAGIDRGWGYQPGATAGLDQPALDELLKRQRPAPINDALKAAIAAVQTPLTLDDFLTLGAARAAQLPSVINDPAAFQGALLKQLRAEVGIDSAAQVIGKGAAAKIVRQASQRFPDAWTQAADAFGPLRVRLDTKGRCWAYTHTGPDTYARLPLFGIVRGISPGAGFMTVPQRLGTAVHEYAHRLQAALPELDRIFQDLHRRRTAGMPLRRLMDLQRGYGPRELTREDSYMHPYQGKEYASQGALEVMSMAFEWVLGAEGPRGEAQLAMLAQRDPEMIQLVLGLLFGWRP